MKKKKKKQPRYLSKHKYVVLLVLENRSFDSFFGFLPHPKGINGLQDKAYGYKVDPSTNAPQDILSHTFKPHISDDVLTPRVDPNEEYQDQYESFTGTQWHFSSKQLSEYPDLPMNGFVSNYYRALSSKKREPLVQEVQEVMNVLAPTTIPVFSGLALHFGLADNYFCDVPSNTLSNRTFLQSVNSNGNVTNQNYFGIQSWLTNKGHTLYDRLEEGHITWRVYYDTNNVFPTSFLVNFPSTQRYKERFVPLASFFKDVENGTLAQFQLVEPRFIGLPSDCHPIDSDSLCSHNSLRAGEQLVLTMYTAIRESPIRDEVLFLITFDEGGNLFDHVPPPSTVSPYPRTRPTEMAFDFQRLGQRVPMIMISSWLPSCTLIHRQLQHSSLIRSLCKKWDLRHINARDRSAPRYPDKSLFKCKYARVWPDLRASLAVDFLSPLHCVIPNANPHIYFIEKVLMNLFAQELSRQFFDGQSKSAVIDKLQYFTCVLNHFNRFCDQVQEQTGFCFWTSRLASLFEIKFFFKRRDDNRVVDAQESKHRARFSICRAREP
jgi:phospholipase C